MIFISGDDLIYTFINSQLYFNNITIPTAYSVVLFLSELSKEVKWTISAIKNECESSILIMFDTDVSVRIQDYNIELFVKHEIMRAFNIKDPELQNIVKSLKKFF